MSRRRRLLIWGAALLAAAPAVLVAVLWVAANTDPGRRAVERLTAQLSGGGIVVGGLAGPFPGELRIARLELRDARGTWLTATDITLRASAAPLLWRQAEVQLLRAGYVGLARTPVTAARARSDGHPWLRQLDVDRLEIARLEIGPALAGAAATLEVRGDVHAGAWDDARATFSARRLDGPGVYEFAGHVDPAGVGAKLDVREPAGGPLANLAGLPGLGDLALRLLIEGPPAAQSTHLTLSAGPLRAAADGTVNWIAGSADLDVSANSPSMALRPDLSWESLALQAHFHGAFTAPAVTAQLRIDSVRAGDVRFRSLNAEAHGNAGLATVAATLQGLRLPGPRPGLLEASPIELSIEAKLDDPARPLTFSLSHSLVSLQGHASVGERASATFTAAAPSIAPFADVVGLELQGQGTLSGTVSAIDGEVRAALTGALTGTRGSGVLARLLGPAASVQLTAARRGPVLTIDRALLDTGAMHASVTGTDRDGVLALKWSLALPKLASLSSSLAGSALVEGEIQGELDNFGGSAEAKASVSMNRSAPGTLALSVHAQGLPRSPSVTLEARGVVDDAPLRVLAGVDPGADGGTHVFIRRADWRSASATGELTLPTGSAAAHGRLSLHLPDLQDLSRIAGVPLQGSVEGSVDVVPGSRRPRAEVRLDARRAGSLDRQVGHLGISGHVDDPFDHPVFALHVVAEDIVTPTLSGSARLEAQGPARSLSLDLSSRWHGGGPDAAEVTSTGTLDLDDRRLGIATLEARLRGQTARLLAPTRLYFRDGASFDVVRIGVQQAVLEVAGTVSPILSATASLRNAPLSLLAIVEPDWRAEGVITADARLTGTVGAPEGTVHLSGKGLRLRTGLGRGMPLTDVAGSASFHGDGADIDLRIHADTAGDLSLVGTVPLRSDQPVDLRANGNVALATANPFLEPDGRRVRGQVAIDATLKGTRESPLIAGTLALEHGDFQDFVRGTHLSEVALTLQATDRSVRVTRLLGHAGSGTVAAEGTIGLFEPALPVDLQITAINAQPLSNDLLTARVDATLTIRGEARGRLEARGRVRVNRADINIPNAFPREVAVLDVRRPGTKLIAAPRRPVARLGLDVTVEAPRAVFVRGRGIDAELGGDLHVGGTSDAPQFSGGFDMRRGTLALAGASLKFTHGSVTFNGAGVRTSLDPTLDFVADSTSSDVTATLTVGGYASSPTVVLTSAPELPQDEILARLLFGQSAKQLTALQLLRIGVALASISGTGYGGADPLAAIQKRLGLDRLAVGGGSGSGPDSSAATVEAGRYATERIYVGAIQSTAGTTKLQVQVDLTKHLKLQTVVGSGSTAAQGTTPQNDPGNTVGLSYQIDY